MADYIFKIKNAEYQLINSIIDNIPQIIFQALTKTILFVNRH